MNDPIVLLRIIAFLFWKHYLVKLIIIKVSAEITNVSVDAMDTVILVVTLLSI